MKIRIGFVSNSSSSSYLVAGFYINPITEPSDDYYEWWEKNEENKRIQTKELRERTGESRISLFDPQVNAEQGTPLIVGYRIGYGDSPMEVDVEDMEELSPIIQTLIELRDQFLLAGRATRDDRIKIIAGEEGNE